MEEIDNVIFSDKIVTLYHVTLLSNYDSIEEFGLDPNKRKVIPMPKEIYDKFNKNMIEKLGRPVPELPYHYTHFPPCIYLSSVKAEAFKYYDHLIKKLRVKIQLYWRSRSQRITMRRLNVIILNFLELNPGKNIGIFY